MLNIYNPNVEPRNFNDDLVFSQNAQCIFVVYRPGAGGDLLASIVNSHYLNTGADYFGISETGQVIFRPSDYKITNTYPYEKLFSDQWCYDISDSLSGRNKSYSNLDNMIFSNHNYKQHNIEKILTHLPNSKVIKIYAQNTFEQSLIDYQGSLKNFNKTVEIEFTDFQYIENNCADSDRVLNIPYISLFNQKQFEYFYSKIIDFLQLEGKLIRFDFIEYYISKQTDYFQEKLREYQNHKINQ